MLPKTKGIIAPEGGWKAHTLYLVEVSMHTGNPIHTACFHVGFLNEDGSPGAYSATWSGVSDPINVGFVHYLKPLKELHTEEGY